MSLSIVVNGGGTFTASMEEGPVSFTASLAAVGPQGPAGATGATGPGVAVGGTTGQVLAKASATNYDTEWVARNPFDQSLDTTDSPTFAQVTLNAGGPASLVITNTDVIFSDATQQSTALPSGLDDGYIVEWNADTNTYASVPNDARTLFITARNITGTTIPKGSVVLITGASGNRPTIGLAQGDTSANADGVIGITAAAINNNANGRVITEGLASNLDTDAFAAGDKLYLSAVTPGGLVNVRPVQPAHSVAVGVVTRSNPAVGSIEVRVQVGEHLEFLHDVLLTSNTNLDLLSYETSSGLWKNKSFSTLGLLTSATAASTYAAIASTNTFTASQVISVTDNSNAALRVTQLGTGDAFLVEDSATPDASAFRIGNGGQVGVGLYDALKKLSVQGATYLRSTTADIPLEIDNRGTGVSLLVRDEASDTTPFIVDAGGNVGVKTASPSTDFEVNGNAKFTTGNITTAPAAADSSSLIPTTAWVQAEVPAASTTAAGKVELATDAEAVAGTSATLAVTPSGSLNGNVSSSYHRFYGPDFTAANSGTGGINDSFGSGAARRTFGTTSAGAGYVTALHGIPPFRGQTTNGNLNWSRRVVVAARIVRAAASPSSESIFRVTIGEVSGSNTGDPAVAAIGIKVVGSGAMEILAHDGTSLTTFSTSHTPAVSQAFDLILVSDGAGNVEAFVNGSSVGSTTGGPTTLLAGTATNRQFYCKVENTSSFTSGPNQYYTYTPAVAVL